MLSFQHRRSVGNQSECRPQVKDQATQTTHELHLPLCVPTLNESLQESEISHHDSRDMEWSLTCDLESDNEANINEEEDATEEKFIVFRSNLEQLLKKCASCGCLCHLQKHCVGTCVIYKIICLECGITGEWKSQPFSGTMPLGNLILSAAIMFSGSSPVQTLRMLDFAGITNISASTYMNMQAAYLTPAIRSVWQQKQSDMIDERHGRQLRLGGDGRCCSPGHTAKFGSYSLMDLETGHVLDTQLVQVVIL